MRKFLVVLAFLMLTGCATLGNVDRLTKSNYEKYKNEKAAVIYGVNWGRQWGCAEFENAQIMSLTFTRIDPESGRLDEENNITLKTPSQLFVDNESIPYAIIINPGEYAISGFDIKVAKSVREIWHRKAGISELFENGKPLGGTFEVSAGEIVYIGNFGLDCAYEPIPWRYYIEKKDFESFIDGFRKKYGFVGNKQIIYRLFQTKNFGQ